MLREVTKDLPIVGRNRVGPGALAYPSPTGLKIRRNLVEVLKDLGRVGGYR
jgi:hypothetical protein